MEICAVEITARSPADARGNSTRLVSVGAVDWPHECTGWLVQFPGPDGQTMELAFTRRQVDMARRAAREYHGIIIAQTNLYPLPEPPPVPPTAAPRGLAPLVEPV